MPAHPCSNAGCAPQFVDAGRAQQLVDPGGAQTIVQYMILGATPSFQIRSQRTCSRNCLGAGTATTVQPADGGGAPLGPPPNGPPAAATAGTCIVRYPGAWWDVTIVVFIIVSVTYTSRPDHGGTKGPGCLVGCNNRYVYHGLCYLY